MSLLLRMVPTWVPVALILLATACGTVLLHQRNAARLDASIARTAQASLQARAQAALAEAESRARAVEQALQRRVDAAEVTLAAERKKNAATEAALRAARLDADSLRSDIARYAASSDPGADTLAACRDRAETLGALLGEALRSSEASAADGESCESGLRAVLSAWPE